MNKNSFIFEYSYFDKLNWCNDTEFRRIINALICFDRDGEIVELTDTEKIAFNIIKVDLEANRKKYVEKCEKNRQIALGKWESMKLTDEGLSKKQRNGLIRSERLKQARELATHTKEEWEEMKDFFNYTCVKCGSQNKKIVKDHITPIYQGGSDGIENLQPLCYSCNSSKGANSTDYREQYCKEHNIENPYKRLRSQ